MRAERVILIGLSGSGKSVVAPLVAERLGYELIDIDAVIERRVGLTIAEIFSRFGERVFRAVERDVLAEACSRRHVVVASGGGAVLDEANWAAMRPAGVIVHLEGSPATLGRRLMPTSSTAEARGRPLLSGNTTERLGALREARSHLYARADAVVDTDGSSPSQVADLVVTAVRDREGAGLVPVASLATPTGRSDLYVAPGLLACLGTLTAGRFPAARRAWIVSDDGVAPFWAASAAAALEAAGLAASVRIVPAGEPSKSMAQVERLLDWVLDAHLDRRDVVIALGGGVVGDLAGFVASIALRGVGLVQVPTSLLAMVDSSVGGKTGVDHPLGKNLIGSFYQPHLVLADTNTLRTLPERQLRAGWAEIVKHAMIERSATGATSAGLLDLIEAAPYPLRLPAAELAEVVRRNVALKAAVVAQDERESGIRRLLNYGHTLGHAMEATGYRYLHGEAIALGMRAAALLASRLEVCDEAVPRRQAAMLDGLGLPDRFEGDLATVLERLTHDKKAVHGRLTWILPTDPGTVAIRGNVPLDVVEDVARALGAA